MEGHVALGEGENAPFVALVALVKDAPAKQRQLLHPDSMFPCQRKIGPDAVRCSRPACRNAIESEDTNTGVLSESGEKVLHARSAHGVCRPIVRTLGKAAVAGRARGRLAASLMRWTSCFPTFNSGALGLNPGILESMNSFRNS